MLLDGDRDVGAEMFFIDALERSFLLQISHPTDLPVLLPFGRSTKAIVSWQATVVWMGVSGQETGLDTRPVCKRKTITQGLLLQQSDTLNLCCKVHRLTWWFWSTFTKWPLQILQHNATLKRRPKVVGERINRPRHGYSAEKQSSSLPFFL